MNCIKKTSVIYTFLHFWVDFSTIFLIANVLLGPKVAMVHRANVIILYNLIAFAGQLPIGIMADMTGKNKLYVSFSCILAAIAYPAAFVAPWVACFLAALGNGAFHIGAGADILHMSMPKSGLSGIFVSSGALGVWLAYRCGGTGFALLCPLICAISAICLMFTKNTYTSPADNTIHFSKPKSVIALAILCFMLTIVIRSLIGSVMKFSWQHLPLLSFASVLALAGGKALGGILGDKFGCVKVALVSLGISLVAFCFSHIHIIGLIAILCFNMTMPITLTAIADLCNKKYGFAFGLTTFALAMGFLPVVFGVSDFSANMLCLTVAISIVLILLGFYASHKGNRRE